MFSQSKCFRETTATTKHSAKLKMNVNKKGKNKKEQPSPNIYTLISDFK